MRRPGPLQELPLDRFIIATNPCPKSVVKVSNKRPLSPGAPSLFSPAKRRILNQEGIWAPERTLKSPISGSRGRAPAVFIGDIYGADSPAKKLDFGLPKNYSDSSQTCMPPNVALKLEQTTLPLPLNVCPHTPNASFYQDEGAMNSYFSPRHTPQSTHTAATLPSSDRHSVHYPGFDIFHDSNVFSTLSETRNEASDSETDDGEDASKENVPPRRKTKKISATSDIPPSKVALLFPEAKKPEMMRTTRTKYDTPATPKKNATVSSLYVRPTTPTPRRPEPRLSQLTPGLTPGISRKEKRERRRLLEVEVDHVRGEEDDDELL